MASKTTLSKFVMVALRNAANCMPLDDEQKISLRNLDLAVDTPDAANGMTLTPAGEAALKAPREVKEVDPMAKKPKVTKKDTIARKDAEMTKKYKHFEAGSLRAVAGESKLRCTIKCCAGSPGQPKKAPGCEGERVVYSSDVFQVKVCEACRDFREPKVKKEKKPRAKAKVTVKKTPKAKPEAAPAPVDPVAPPPPTPEPAVDSGREEQNPE